MIEIELENKLQKIVNEVNDIGFTVVPEMLSLEKVRETTDILMKINSLEQKKTLSSNNGCLRVGDLVVKHEIFLELLCHAEVLRLIEKFLGKGFVCSAIQSNTLLPHQGQAKYDWHIDYPYHGFSPTSWEYEKLSIQVIWMLKDFTRDNGATGALPKSHKSAKMPDRDKTKWWEDAIVAEGKQGSIYISWGSLWHTQTLNYTNEPRPAVIVQYVKPYVIPQEDLAFQLEQMGETSDIVKHLLHGNRYNQQRNIYGVNRGIEYSPYYPFIWRIRAIKKKIKKYYYACKKQHYLKKLNLQSI